MLNIIADSLTFSEAKALAIKTGRAALIRPSPIGNGFCVLLPAQKESVVECGQAVALLGPLSKYLLNPYIPCLESDSAPRIRDILIRRVVEMSADDSDLPGARLTAAELLLGGPFVVPGKPGGDQHRIFKENAKAPNEFQKRLNTPNYVELVDGFPLDNGRLLRKLLDLGRMTIFALGRNRGMHVRDAFFQSVAEITVCNVAINWRTFTAGPLFISRQDAESGKLSYLIDDADIEELCAICQWGNEHFA